MAETVLDEEVFRHTSFLRTADLNRVEAEILLERAARYLRAGADIERTLAGRMVFNLFMEPSTRTRASFEIAAKRLGADVINLASAGSSTKKGESLRDTLLTLDAMGADLIVLRHAAAGAAAFAQRVTQAAIVNAGDGAHAHPTQALLDALTLQTEFGRVEGLTLAICGDIAHSRVARSAVVLLQLLGAQIRIAAPATLIPPGMADWGVTVCASAREAAQDCDVVMALRVQHERLDGVLLPSQREYAQFFGVTDAVLAAARPGVKLMHPGPMNRGVEVTAALAEDPAYSLITDQVTAGAAARMAVLALVDAAQQRLAARSGSNTP